MPTPAYSVRVTPKHRDLIKRTADLLAAGRARDLRCLLDDLDAAPVGPFRSVEAYTEHVVRGLILHLDPDEVWLFGSRARGDHRPDSDLDLLAVLPDGLKPEHYTYAHANPPLLGGWLPVEVFPVARSRFEADPEALGGLVIVAKTEGRRLYRAGRLDRMRHPTQAAA
jgi:predicted nucleotidyltransferase